MVVLVAGLAIGLPACLGQAWTAAAAVGGSGNASGNGLLTDPAGNIYVTGAFTGTVDFGNGIVMNAAGQADIFVAKYNPGGAILWAVKAGKTKEDIGQELFLDSSGDLYVTGSFSDSIRWTTASGSVAALGLGMTDLFVVKLDPANGQAYWVSTIGGAGSDEGTSLTVNGNAVYVTGYFEANATAGGIPLTSYGGRDALLANYNQLSNTWTWAINGGTPAEDESQSICLVGAYLYVCGKFAGPAFNFGSQTCAGLGGVDGFVARVSPAGVVAWTSYIGSATNDEVSTAIATDGTDVYVCGNSSGPGTVTFYGIPLRTATTAGALSEFWVARFAVGTGYCQWSQAEGGPGNDLASGVIANGAGVMAVTGSFENSVVLASLPLSGPGSELFVESFNSSTGSPLSAVSAGGPGATSSNDLYFDPNCGIVFTGRHSLALNFPSLTTLNASGALDGFISRLSVAAFAQPTQSPQLTSVCVGSSLSISVSGAVSTITWESSTDNGLTWTNLSGLTTPTITVTPLQDTWYRSTFSGLCIGGRDTTMVTVGGLNPAAIVGLPDTLCTTASAISFNVAPAAPLGTISLAGSGFTNLGGGNMQFNAGVAGPGMHKITYAYTDNVGCSSTASDSVLVDAPPTLNITGLNPSYCQADTTPHLLTGSLAPAGNWSSTCGCLIDQGNGTALLTPSMATAGSTFWIRYSDNQTCFSQVLMPTIVNAALQLVVPGTPDSLCNDDAPDTLTANSTSVIFSPASPGFVDLGNGIAIFDPTACSPGSYSFDVSPTMGTCAFSDSFTIVVDSLPTVTLTGLDTNFCAHDLPGSFFGNYASGYSYAPMQPCFQDLGNGNFSFDPSVASIGTVNLTYTYTLPSGCDASATRTVVVNSSLPLSVAGAPDSVCNFDPAVTIQANSSTAVFSPLSAGFADQGNGTAIFDPSLFSPGYHTFFVDGLPGTCAIGDTFTVRIDSVPVSTLQVTDSIFCAGDAPLTLVGNHASGYSYSPNQPYLLDLGGGNLQFDPSIAPIGLTTVVFNYTSPAGCFSSVSKTLWVNALPSAAISGLSAHYCADGAAQTITGNQGAFGSFQGGPWLADLGGSTATLNPALAAFDSLNLVVYAVMDSNGCLASDSQWVFVGNPPVAKAGVDHTVCQGNAVTIGNIAVSGVTYSWQDLNSPWTSNLAQPTVTPSVSTVYALTAVDTLGCQDADSVTVTVNLPPTVNAGLDLGICLGDTATLMAATSGNALVSWNDSTGWLSGASALTVSPIQTHTYLLIAQDLAGSCQDSDWVMVVVTQPAAPADAGLDIHVNLDAEVPLAASDPSPGMGTWTSLGVNLDFDDPQSPTAKIEHAPPGEWTLVWSVTNGPCPASADSMKLFVEEMIYPTGFSPNGDGVNDVLVFSGLLADADATLHVFNRWGELMWTGEHYQNDWGGTNASGQPLVDDTYYYVLELDHGQPVQRFLVLKR